MAFLSKLGGRAVRLFGHLKFESGQFFPYFLASRSEKTWHLATGNVRQPFPMSFLNWMSFLFVFNFSFCFLSQDSRIFLLLHSEVRQVPFLDNIVRPPDSDWTTSWHRVTSSSSLMLLCDWTNLSFRLIKNKTHPFLQNPLTKFKTLVHRA